MYGIALGCVFVLLAAYAGGTEHHKISIYQLPPSIKERMRAAKPDRKKRNGVESDVRSAWESLDLEHKGKGLPAVGSFGAVGLQEQTYRDPEVTNQNLRRQFG